MAAPYLGQMPRNPFGQEPDFSGVQSLAPQPAPLSLPTPKIKKGGMFGNTDWTGAISAALNGYLAAGGNPAGLAGLQQQHQQRMLQQQEAIRAQEYARERQDGRDDYLWKQEHDIPQPTEFERLLISRGFQPGTQEYNRHLDAYLGSREEGPPMLTTINGQPVLISRNSAMGGGAAPSGGPAIGTVEDGYRFKGGNASDPNAWEPVQGGPTPQASGGFPGPY